MPGLRKSALSVVEPTEREREDDFELEELPAGVDLIPADVVLSPRQRLSVTCTACRKRQRMLLRQGSHTEYAASRVAGHLSKQKCGKCGGKIAVQVALHPKNWFQRLIDVFLRPFGKSLK